MRSSLHREAEEDVAFLIRGNLNEEDKLCLYYASDGVRLNRLVLAVQPDKGRYQLVGGHKLGWEVIHSVYVKDSGLRFEQIIFDDSGKLFNTRHLITFPEFQTNYVSWSATARLSGKIFLAINQYILVVENERVNIRYRERVYKEESTSFPSSTWFGQFNSNRPLVIPVPG